MGGHRSEMILEIESRGEQSRWDKCVPVELWGSTEDGEAHHEDMFTVTWRFLSAIGWIWRGASRPWVLEVDHGIKLGGCSFLAHKSLI